MNFENGSCSFWFFNQGKSNNIQSYLNYDPIHWYLWSNYLIFSFIFNFCFPYHLFPFTEVFRCIQFSIWWIASSETNQNITMISFLQVKFGLILFNWIFISVFSVLLCNKKICHLYTLPKPNSVPHYV